MLKEQLTPPRQPVEGRGGTFYRCGKLNVAQSTPTGGFRVWTADPEFAAKAQLMAKWACNHVR